MVLALALLWLAWFAALGLAALPVTAAVLSPLDGRGTGFAVTLGATVVSLVAFWAGHLAFGYGAVALGLGVLVAFSAGALRRGVTVPWRHYGETMGVFALAFGFAVGVRSLNPNLAIWAELYLDYGLVQSLLRASRFPLEDMWFAGRPVQYYYGGHLTTATWATVTQTPGRYLPNLALAGFYAMLATGAYDLAGTLGGRLSAPRRLAGALGAFLLGFAGNLFTPVRLLLVGLPDGPATALREWLSLSPDLLAGPFFVWEATHLGATNTDVPVYSLLVQSLHPHVMSQPFTLLVAAVACAYFLTPVGNWRARVGRLLAAAPVVGLVALTNTWSLAAACGVPALAVAFGATRGSQRGERSRLSALGREFARYGAALLAGAALLGLAVAWVAPFFLVTDASRPLGFLPERSGVRLFVVGYGAFLALFWLHLWRRVCRPPTRAAVAGFAVAALAAAGWGLDFVALAFVGPVLLAGWWLLRRGEAGFEGVLILAGAGLALAVELAYVKGGAMPGRYNTLYKVHSQVWLLWSVGGGAVAASLLASGGPFPDGATRLRERALALRAAPAWDLARLVAVVALLAAVSIYGVFGVASVANNDHTPGEGPTLDAVAFLERDHPDQLAAIRWLDAREGRPTIVSGAVREDEMYVFEAAPAASLTGLPTVVGWAHVADYHSAAAYRERVRDVRTIYEGSAPNRSRLLRQYDVAFVYVGPFERSKYTVADLAAQPGVRRAFARGRVVVYAVDQSALPEDRQATAPQSNLLAL